MKKYPLSVHLINSESDVIKCLSLMQQLRPHITSEKEFLERWKRQVEQGYQLVGLLDGQRAVALAGYRFQDNLVHGLFMYVDDLVTDKNLRSSGYGEQLIAYLREKAQKSGATKLVLDTPMSNFLGHKFYFRCGLFATALNFSIQLEK